LMDSGSLQHISPYRKDFNNFVEIEPKPLKAANKETFAATGTGDLVLELPD
ncbi:hypothetical protein DENSPDRAFT_741709, partial [Dentipellis sp. KUC8613]